MNEDFELLLKPVCNTQWEIYYVRSKLKPKKLPLQIYLYNERYYMGKKPSTAECFEGKIANCLEELRERCKKGRYLD